MLTTRLQHQPPALLAPSSPAAPLWLLVEHDLLPAQGNTPLNRILPFLSSASHFHTSLPIPPVAEHAPPHPQSWSPPTAAIASPPAWSSRSKSHPSTPPPHKHIHFNLRVTPTVLQYLVTSFAAKLHVASTLQPLALPCTPRRSLRPTNQPRAREPPLASPLPLPNSPPPLPLLLPTGSHRTRPRFCAKRLQIFQSRFIPPLPPTQKHLASNFHPLLLPTHAALCSLLPPQLRWLLPYCDGSPPNTKASITPASVHRQFPNSQQQHPAFSNFQGQSHQKKSFYPNLRPYKSKTDAQFNLGQPGCLKASTSGLTMTDCNQLLYASAHFTSTAIRTALHTLMENAFPLRSWHNRRCSVRNLPFTALKSFVKMPCSARTSSALKKRCWFAQYILPDATPSYSSPIPSHTTLQAITSSVATKYCPRAVSPTVSSLPTLPLHAPLTPRCLLPASATALPFAFTPPSYCWPPDTAPVPPPLDTFARSWPHPQSPGPPHCACAPSSSQPSKLSSPAHSRSSSPASLLGQPDRVPLTPHTLFFLSFWSLTGFLKLSGHPHLKVAEIFPQSHRLGRLHLVDHLKDFLDIFLLETITAKTHHPAATPTLRNHEIIAVPRTHTLTTPQSVWSLFHRLLFTYYILVSLPFSPSSSVIPTSPAKLQKAISKMISRLLHCLCHLQNCWLLPVNPVHYALGRR